MNGPKVVQPTARAQFVVMTLDRYDHMFARGDDRAEFAPTAQALPACPTATREGRKFLMKTTDV